MTGEKQAGRGRGRGDLYGEVGVPTVAGQRIVRDADKGPCRELRKIDWLA